MKESFGRLNFVSCSALISVTRRRCLSALFEFAMASKYFETKELEICKGKANRRRKAVEDNKDAGISKKSKQTSDDTSVPEITVPDKSSLGSGLSKKSSKSKLGHTFYDVPCTTLARKLLGQHVVRFIDQQKIRGRIVETESYIGPIDKAAHSYQGKKTPRNEAMFMSPGTCYVYNIYGMYCCMNISSQGDGAAVLIRAIEPIEGQPLMEEGRRGKTSENKKGLKEKDLANGPSKLCQAFHITKDIFNKSDLTTSDALWLEDGDSVDENAIISCARINIGYAEDWKDKPLRFYIQGNKSVSVKDKKAEQEHKSITPSPATSDKDTGR